ncbi:MAG TPA: hypothetical protein PLM25_01455 [Limnochordia bacterium]|jgi:hypothetical protein|nr:hypothetical protein [Limnochordia bacterium]
MTQLSKKEKAELIAAAMKAISEQKGLSPEARQRGLEILQKAYMKNTASSS